MSDLIVVIWHMIVSSHNASAVRSLQIGNDIGHAIDRLINSVTFATNDSFSYVSPRTIRIEDEHRVYKGQHRFDCAKAFC